MDILAAIHTRRSVRSFAGFPVSPDAVTTLLEAAMAAPSAGNSRPWRFVVVTERALLDAVPAIHPHAGMAKSAPLAILVCGDLTAEKYPGFWVQDCSAAVQNLLLAAVGTGLGAVWTGIYPDKERTAKFSELFRLPENFIPLAFVIVGHPKAPQERQNRFNPDYITYNTWNKPENA